MKKNSDIVFDQFDFYELVDAFSFPLICIYFHPLDYPDKYVARVWNLDIPTNRIAIGDNLEDVLNAIPAEMRRISRCTKDDPCIVETWF